MFDTDLAQAQESYSNDGYIAQQCFFDGSSAYFTDEQDFTNFKMNYPLDEANYKNYDIPKDITVGTPGVKTDENSYKLTDEDIKNIKENNFLIFDLINTLTIF